MVTILSFYITGKSGAKYRFSQSHKGDKFWCGKEEISKTRFEEALTYFKQMKGLK